MGLPWTCILSSILLTNMGTRDFCYRLANIQRDIVRCAHCPSAPAYWPVSSLTHGTILSYRYVPLFALRLISTKAGISYIKPRFLRAGMLQVWFVPLLLPVLIVGRGQSRIALWCLLHPVVLHILRRLAEAVSPSSPPIAVNIINEELFLKIEHKDPACIASIYHHCYIIREIAHPFARRHSNESSTQNDTTRG